MVPVRSCLRDVIADGRQAVTGQSTDECSLSRSNGLVEPEAKPRGPAVIQDSGSHQRSRRRGLSTSVLKECPEKVSSFRTPSNHPRCENRSGRSSRNKGVRACVVRNSGGRIIAVHNSTVPVAHRMSRISSKALFVSGPGVVISAEGTEPTQRPSNIWRQVRDTRRI